MIVKEIFSLFLLIVFGHSIMVASELNVPDRKKIEKYHKMSLCEIMEVEIITANDRVLKGTQLPLSMVSLTREDIKKHGCQTLAEVIEKIHELYSVAGYPGKEESSMAPNNILILVDGTTIPSFKEIRSIAGVKALSFPVGAIERIEVIRVPLSITSESGKFYEVISIVTDRKINRKSASCEGKDESLIEKKS